MNISEHFGGAEQDEKVERLQAMLAFRELVYGETRSEGEQAHRVAGCLMFALFGSHYEYKPCCILHFVKHAYAGTIPDKVSSEVDGRTMCEKCQAESHGGPV